MRRSVEVLEHGRIAVEITTTPLEITIRRDGRRLIGPVTPRVRDGEIEDQFIQFTEGVIAHETLGDPLEIDVPVDIAFPAPDHIVLELRCPDGPQPVRRLGLTWHGHPEQRLTG